MFILSTRFSSLKFNTYMNAALAEMDQRQVEALEMLDRYQQAAPCMDRWHTRLVRLPEEQDNLVRLLVCPP